MPRSHNKTHFYKYTSSSAVKKILSSRRMRWSSPLRFNDPFDHQMEFDYGFDLKTFVEKFTIKIEDIIFGEKNIKLDANNQLATALKTMRIIRDKLTREEVMKELGEVIQDMPKFLTSIRNDLNSKLQASLTSMRVLCVTEDKDNLVMWSHYADKHSGVVIRLQCIDAIDNGLLVAEPANYTNTMPVIVGLDELVQHVTGENTIDLTKSIPNIWYTKSKHWAYEKEWRIAMPEPTAGSNLYNDYEEDPQVFGAVYMGCRSSKEDQDEILSFLTGELEHVELYRAHKQGSSFGLYFEKIK